LFEKSIAWFKGRLQWISKGKAGVPVELGLRVAIVEDQHRFILHHQVMEKTTDDKVAVTLVEQTQTRFPALKAMSFDKGFHSPANQVDLRQRLETVVLPKKGRLSEADKARESAPEFVRLRRLTFIGLIAQRSNTEHRNFIIPGTPSESTHGSSV